jgi:hypothetical protein
VKTLFEFFSEFGIAAIAMVFPFVPWTKMTFGGCLVLMGAFFRLPSSRQHNGAGDQLREGGNLDITSNAAKFSGGVRFAVVCCGGLLLFSSLSDGVSGYQASKRQGPLTNSEFVNSDASDTNAERERPSSRENAYRASAHDDKK